MNTVDYLYKNNNNIVAGIMFTTNDLKYLKKIKDTGIIINDNKPTREELNEHDIIARLEDLFKLAEVSGTTARRGQTSREFMEEVRYNFKAMEKDFNIEINIG